MVEVIQPSRRLRGNARAAPAGPEAGERSAAEGAASAAGADGTVILPEIPVRSHARRARVARAGEIFGEGSALSRYPIATDIVAATDVTCLLIRTPALRAMLDLPELAAFKALFDQRYKQRALRAHLHRVDLFKDLGRRASSSADRSRRARDLQARAR